MRSHEPSRGDAEQGAHDADGNNNHAGGGLDDDDNDDDDDPDKTDDEGETAAAGVVMDWDEPRTVFATASL